MEVSLGEASQTQHRYQISRGQGGEVNIDVVVEDGEARGAERDIVIDNKDYNYTLIISGQNIQVIHHDTNRNLTYRHGLDVRRMINAFKLEPEWHCRKVRFLAWAFWVTLGDPQPPSNSRTKRRRQNLRDLFPPLPPKVFSFVCSFLSFDISIPSPE